MNDAGQKPSLEIELRLRDLPAEVKRSRELARQENERLELAARPRMEPSFMPARWPSSS